MIHTQFLLFLLIQSRGGKEERESVEEHNFILGRILKKEVETYKVLLWLRNRKKMIKYASMYNLNESLRKEKMKREMKLT